MIELRINIDYQKLIDRIGNIYESAKSEIVSAVNIEMLPNLLANLERHI